MDIKTILIDSMYIVYFEIAVVSIVYWRKQQEYEHIETKILTLTY